MFQSPATKNGTLTTGQKYDAEYDVADDLTDLGPMLFRQTPCTVTKFRVQRKMVEVNYLSLGTFSSELSKGAVSSVSDIAFVIVSLTEYSDSDLESNLKKPIRMRSNTTNAGDLEKIVFLDVILPGACAVCPRILTTSQNKRQIRSVQQSLGKFVGIEYNTEENDDMLEENYTTVYVKMINGKTISIRYHRNMTAAVISDEVERRSFMPRDMIRLVHKGELLSEKKTMKENNIEAKATIEMSLRLLGGMEVNEQMTHETEEDREKKRKLEEGKEGKATKPTDDMVYLKRDMMEALIRSDEKMDSYSRKTDEKMECYSRKTDEKRESYSKKTDERMNDFSRKADELLERFMLGTSTVGSQIQGMNSSIAKMQETNKK